MPKQPRIVRPPLSKIIRPLAFSLFALFALAMCTSANQPGASRALTDSMPLLATQAAPADALPEEGQFRQQTETEFQQDRLIIRNATLTLTVDDVAARLSAITALADEFGGWVVSSNSSAGADERVLRATVVLRIPAERLNDALTRIKDGVASVDSESVTGEDVTQQYVDSTSRLRNLEAAERQLQEIMRTAQDTEDVLAIFDQLTRIRGEIESLRGQIQYFEQASAFSAITVTLNATPVTPPIEVAGWRPGDTLSRAAQTLVNVVQGIVDVAIFILVLLLPLALAALALFVVIRWLWRRLLIRRSARPTAASPESP